MLNNAIQIDKFKFSREKREKIRKELNAEESIIIGHVGGFLTKNHDLLIDIFCEYLKECHRAVLMLIGDGELRESVEQKVDHLKIANQVRFLGVRADVCDLLNAMDVFVFPSRYEGLGVIAIEAQANGLPVVCSGYVPQEVAFADNVFFVDKSKYNDISEWQIAINMALKKGRTKDISALSKAGYDIALEAKKLEAIYKDG